MVTTVGLSTGKYADLSAGFTYLRTQEIDYDALNTDLAPADLGSVPLSALDFVFI